MHTGNKLIAISVGLIVHWTTNGALSIPNDSEYYGDLISSLIGSKTFVQLHFRFLGILEYYVEFSIHVLWSSSYSEAKVNTIKYYVYTENRAVWFLGFGMQKYISLYFIMQPYTKKRWLKVYTRVGSLYIYIDESY